MNIPNLPTDNLYKFMALTGVLVILGSYLIVWFQAERSQELLRELKQAAALVEAKLKIAELTSNVGEKGSKHAQEAHESVLNEKARIVAIEEELRLILDWKPRFMAFLIASQTIGFILSVSGFGLWYTRVQKYQDLLVKSQAIQEQQGTQHSGIPNKDST